MPRKELAIAPAVFDSTETAAYVRRPVSFVRQVLRYEIPVVQHGDRGPLFFYKVDLDRWLAEHTQVPAK